MLDLRRVRVFYEVADRGSFSAAADALGFTQPSVSHHISSLERELGQRLINRGARPVSLTEAGELLRRAAAVALAEIDRAEVGLGALARGEIGRAALGSVVTGLRSVVPAAVRGFGARFPGVDLVLEELQPTDVLDRLRNGRLDVGIVVLTRDGVEPDPGVYASELLVEQELVLVVSSRHRLARRRSVRLETLGDEDWLLPSSARFPEFRSEVDGLLSDAGVVPRRVVDVTDDVAAGRLIAAGVGVGVAPRVQVVPVPGVAVVSLSPRVTRRLLAVTVAGTSSAPVLGLLEELRAAARFVPAEVGSAYT
jgi:DNA-binding transcriptional LysR family regulator